MPTDLVENELFGHVKGAYTTAHAGRSGLVREAEGGTLFLDDVDCLPLSAQVKLLRFVQEREYRAVGSNSVQRADVRLIAASNHRLPQMVARGEFRQDLYFRLNVLTLELPPLRERRSDIAALAQHFLRRFSERHGRRVAAISPSALERLMSHDWPGNVRELQHAIERAVLLARGPTLGEDDIEIDGAGPAEAGDATFRAAKDRVVRQFERGYIERLLASCGGNVTHAAMQAGKNRRAFFELMRKHDIRSAPFRGGESIEASRSR
jgi:DNA-binding NtrC family response regulator